MNAVGAHEEVSVYVAVILEVHLYAIPCGFEAVHARAQTHGPWATLLQCIRQHGVEIGAMQMIIGKSVLLDTDVAEWARQQYLTRLPVPHLAPLWLERNGFDSLTQPQAVQYTRAVGADLHTRADFAQSPSLLQYRDLKTLMMQT